MMQQPKILQVIPRLQSGGAEQTAVDIGNAVVVRGWISVVASAGGRMTEQLIAAGSQHVTLPLDSKNPVTIWRNGTRLARLIRQEGVSLIHARSRAPAWSAWLAARRTGIPFVTTYHGSYNQKSWLKAQYNSIMARADVVIANSHWTAALVASRNPWAKERIQVVHRGTDFEAFSLDSVSRSRRDALREQWKLGADDVVLLHLARVTSWKGQDVVIDAVAQLAGDFPKLKVILAGDAQGRGKYFAGLREKIVDFRLQDRVLLPGHCDDPAAAMAVADLVVVASTRAEAFGRAAVEAGALERPVIVTRIGAAGETVLAAPEVAKDQRTGWKVTPNDAAELSQAIRDGLQLTSEERHTVGLRARTHGEANFSLQQMCEKTLAIYEKLLGHFGNTR